MTDITFLAQTPDNIRSALRQAGLSQQDCATRAGIPAATLIKAIFADEPMLANEWGGVLAVCQNRIDVFAEGAK